MRQPRRRRIALIAAGRRPPLEAFGFDSLSLFAFILELERTCGLKFDDTLLNHQQLRSVRSVAALIASRAESQTADARIS